MAITVNFVATAQFKLFAIRFLPRLTVTSPTHSLAAARFLRFATIPQRSQLPVGQFTQITGLSTATLLHQFVKFLARVLLLIRSLVLTPIHQRPSGLQLLP